MWQFKETVKLLKESGLLVLWNTEMSLHISPVIQFLLRQADLLGELLYLCRCCCLQPIQRFEAHLDTPSGHVVGVGVIVHMFVPLIGADHVSDLIIIVCRILLGATGPEHGGVEE